MFIFVGILSLVYANMPISVDLNAFSLPNIHKQQFFIYAIIAFCVVNAVLRLPLDYLFKGLKSEVYAWILAIVCVLNLYLTFIMGFVGSMNNNNAVEARDFIYLNFLGPLLVVAWIVGLIYQLIQSKKALG